VSGPTRLERARGLPERLHLTEPRRSFGLVLLALIVAVVFQLASPDTDAARVIDVVIQGAVIVLALRAAGASRRMVRPITIGLGVIVVVALAAVLGPVDVADEVPRILTLVLILLAPTAIVAGVIRELHEDGRVTIQTVYCGISLYLLLGLAFSYLFGAIEDLSGEPFFDRGIPGSPNDFLYFSLATLTTTGYGDFRAATELGRAVSVTEALVGQIYLVTVLAVIVSNIGQGRRTTTRQS
jgi:peptidoglycan/LPS O-acetylase OafA/YrhL